MSNVLSRGRLGWRQRAAATIIHEPIESEWTMIFAFALLLAAQQQRTWTVATSPVVSIGEVEGAQEYMFSQVVGAVRLSDGRFAVANGGSNELRVYDSA